MSRTAKCSNYEHCILAYRNEAITLADDAELTCPECGKPVAVAKGAGARGSKATWLTLLLIFFVFVGFIGLSMWGSCQRLAPSGDSVSGGMDGIEDQQPGNGTEEGGVMTPSPAPVPEGGGEARDSTEESAGSADQAQVPDRVSVPDSINMDARSAGNQQVKEEVLKRIDLMPTVSSDDKDQLYMSVERARQMGKIITIPFGFGKRALSREDTANLKVALESPQVQRVKEDPTAVMVILGFADTKGDPDKNQKISADRAEAVLAVLRDELRVMNVMHSVGMGGSTMFDEEGLEKNRVVEVWAVLP